MTARRKYRLGDPVREITDTCETAGGLYATCPHCRKEIRLYAVASGDITVNQCPECWEFYGSYQHEVFGAGGRASVEIVSGKIVS